MSLPPKKKQPESEVNEDDSNFIAIKAKNFVAGASSPFDVFVRLASSKYLKIAHAGEAIQPDRVSAYVSKGLVHFYLRKEDQERYVAYSGKISAGIMKMSAVPDPVKFSQTLHHGDEMMRLFQSYGVSDGYLEYAGQYLSNVESLAKQLDLSKNEVVKAFMVDLASYDHGVSSALISGIICKALDIVGADAIEAIGLASLLHDLGLFHLGFKDPSIEDTGIMTIQERELFLKHPIVGSEMLQGFKKVKPAAIQAIAQHHERRNKQGFPMQVGAGSLSLMAEIVGMSDVFQHILRRRLQNPTLNVASEVKLQILGVFSTKLTAGFEKAFTRLTTP